MKKIIVCKNCNKEIDDLFNAEVKYSIPDAYFTHKTCKKYHPDKFDIFLCYWNAIFYLLALAQLIVMLYIFASNFRSEILFALLLEFYILGVVFLHSIFDYQNKKIQILQNHSVTSQESNCDPALIAFLPILDDIFRAEKALPEASLEQLKTGIRLISEKTRKTLIDNNFEIICDIGIPVDTSIHEVIASGKSTNKKSLVLKVHAYGYKYKGRVIRCAKVTTS